MFNWLFRKPSFFWRSMDSAPRDGTKIEIRCAYGGTPWVKIARSSQHPMDGAIWKIDEHESGTYTYVEDTWDYRGRYQGAKNTDLQWRPLT